MLFFGIIALFLILKPDWVWKYTGHYGRHDYEENPPRFMMWLYRTVGVVLFAIGLYYEFK